MRISIQINKKNKAIQALKELERTAKICGLSHAEIMLRQSEIIATLAKCSGYYRNFVQGYEMALYDARDEHIEFGYIFNDEYYSGYKGTKGKDIELLYKWHKDNNLQLDEVFHSPVRVWKHSLKHYF